MFFNYLVNPGSVISDAVKETNQTTSSIASSSFRPMRSTRRRRICLNPPRALLRSVGAWVKLSDLEFTLPPHTLANVPFTLTVPAGLTPGDYAGGIVLQTVNPSVEYRGISTFNVFQNRHVDVHSNPRPPSPGLSITQLSSTSGWLGYLGGPVSSTVTYRLTNTGNQAEIPRPSSASRLCWDRRRTFLRGSSRRSCLITRPWYLHLPSKEAFLAERQSHGDLRRRIHYRDRYHLGHSVDPHRDHPLDSGPALVPPTAPTSRSRIDRGCRKGTRNRVVWRVAACAGCSALVVAVGLMCGLTVSWAVAAPCRWAPLRTAGLPPARASTSNVSPGETVSIIGHGWPAHQALQAAVSGGGSPP